MVRVRAKIEKNTLFGRALVRIRSKIVKNTLFGRALVRVRAKIEKNSLFGRAFVRIWSKIEKKHPLWQGYWIGLGQNTDKNTFFDRTLTRIRAIEE